MSAHKYLHYMPEPSAVYNDMIIKMINEQEGFNKNEHLFVIKNKASYNISSKYNNVINLQYSLMRITSCKIKDFDYIILHGLDIGIISEVLLKGSTKRKIVWCVWGHDLYRYSNTYNMAGSIAKRLIKRCFLKLIETPLVKRFYAVGYGFDYDIVEIRKLYGNKIKTISAPYGLGYDINTVEKVKSDQGERRTNSTCYNVLVGHSGYEYLNHINILEQLKRFSSNNLYIYIPLNYGNKKYIEEVLSYLEEYPIPHEVLLKPLSPNEYLEYLSNIDIAIFDMKQQAALTNIQLLLFFGKKIYLNDKGVAYKGLHDKFSNIFATSVLDSIEFDQFVNAENIKSCNTSKLKVLDPEAITSDWIKLFTMLT